MEVKITKEIREYSESMFFGLNLRQCICSVIALSIAIGLYFGLKPVLGSEITSWLCIVGAAPFAACGFLKYHSMTAEQFAWVWIKSELLYPKHLVFKTDNIYYVCLQSAIINGKKTKLHQKIKTEAKK